MNTYFIRHSSGLDISEATRDLLWNERLIAIHYPDDLTGKWQEEGDNQSLDPSHYTGRGRQAMSTLLQIAHQGGYVCAQYYGRSELLIGIIPPGSKISLIRGAWGSCDRVAILKTLRLIGSKTLHPRDHCVVAAARPRQGTIARWHAVGDVVASLIEGRSQPPSWSMLSAERQEIGCSEFLRLPEASQLGLPQLQSLLLPVGRTLKDIDFVGIARDGKRIFAQVTSSLLHHAADNGKLEALRQFIDPEQAHVLLFCNCPTTTVLDGVHIVSVEQVFNTLNSFECGRHFLRGIT